MKSIRELVLLATCLCLCQQATAKVWRVNNRSNYNGSNLWGDNYGGSAAYPVFAQINQAVGFGTVANGDTLHVEGSTTLYTNATITKRLVIIGTGYFLTDNPATSNTTLPSQVTYIQFNNNSQGSFVMGMDFVNGGNTADGFVYVNVNDITVKRNRLERGVRFETSLADVYILQNFFPSTIVTNALFTNGNSFFIPPTGIVFNNNICQKTLTWGTPINNPGTLWPLLQCNNNVFDGPDNLANPNLAFSTGEFRNNILMPTNAVVNIAASVGAVAYNIGTMPSQFGTADGNLVVPAITSLFVSSASRDGMYMIADGSQADNNGHDGADRGAFGGAAVTRRYTLSGLPNIPVIYQVTTSGVADNSGLPVTLKARIVQ